MDWLMAWETKSSAPVKTEYKFNKDSWLVSFLSVDLSVSFNGALYAGDILGDKWK